MSDLASMQTSPHGVSQFNLGTLKTVSEVETLASGSVYLRYSALGRVAATGKLVHSDNAAGDGSQVVVAFLPYEVDATAADVEVGVLKAGMFNSDLLALGGTHTASTVKADLEGTPLFIHSPS